MLSPRATVQGKAVLAPELRSALASSRRALFWAAVFSGLINVLALSSSLYMLQVYDRVIPSHSVPTLIGLSVVMLMLFTGYGILDVIRTRVMSRVGINVDRGLRERIHTLVLRMPLQAPSNVDAMQPVRDLDQIRTFMASAGPVALFDLPWLPIYLILVWLLHPWLGILATLGAVVLVFITLITDRRGRAPTRDMAESGARRMSLADSGRRNAAAIRSMGMSRRIIARWHDANERFLADQTAATDVIGTYGAISKVLRLVLQSAVLGLGAYLVILGQATAGVMIAASILVSRALAPIEIAIANWRGFIAVRQSVGRLSQLLNAVPDGPAPTALPPPSKSLEAIGLWVAPPGEQQPVVQNATFTLQAGEGLGVVGPSAAGKSSLTRALIGAWIPMRGAVRLDGAALDQWDPDELGKHIGYLPQELELFPGTVAENIARFDPEAAAEAIIDAARQAGVHDMIVRLEHGYDTHLGDSAHKLSTGQRQRVALARALYGNPFLVVLDEPNSNLDREGDLALDQAIRSVRQRGGIVIVVAHRPSALSAVDKLLVLQPGVPARMGSKEEILPMLLGGQAPDGTPPGAPPRSTPASGVPARPGHTPQQAPATLSPASSNRIRIIPDN